MKEKYYSTYMDCAKNFASLSYAIRKKVGAVVVTPEDVMLYSWNGVAAGDDNCCEDIKYDKENWGVLVTKPTVLHAERNIIAKAAKEGISLKGATLFVTMSCCLECALMIYQAGISKVVYDENYREQSGIEYLKLHGVEVIKYEQ